MRWIFNPHIKPFQIIILHFNEHNRKNTYNSIEPMIIQLCFCFHYFDRAKNSIFTESNIFRAYLFWILSAVPFQSHVFWLSNTKISNTRLGRLLVHVCIEPISKLTIHTKSSISNLLAEWCFNKLNGDGKLLRAYSQYFTWRKFNFSRLFF